MTQQAVAQNAELKVLYPNRGMPYLGFFLVETKNIDYRPEEATSVADFNSGVDVLGNPLQPNVGHIHGWVFETVGGLDKREDSSPSPSAYYRFYGAGGASFYGTKSHGLYLKFDSGLDSGKYRVYFQAQHSDHTAMTQLNAPAFPAIATSTFTVPRFWFWK